ncbi:hypothetical protein GGU11DRAFT_780839 [Lentinula aff. detonsa]|nr:hypothetical protein GGU11DRAFT_780839 [Lentinula aff. detonsa]
MAETVVHSLEFSLEDLLPDVLQPEVPPTAIGHANSLSQWVKWNFKRALTANVHYEHQLYGPDNTYLQSIFPSTRQFSVIPQALLRRAIRKGTIKDLNVSTGSTGAKHWSRNTKGKSVNKTYPDFLAVKVIPTTEDKPRSHYVVCVVEIKLGEDGMTDVEVGDAEMQMYRYMTTLIKHPYRVPDVKGYLLKGSTYSEFKIIGDEVIYTPGQYNDIFAAGDPLTISLCKIAVQEWNRATVDVAPGMQDAFVAGMEELLE